MKKRRRQVAGDGSRAVGGGGATWWERGGIGGRGEAVEGRECTIMAIGGGLSGHLGHYHGGGYQ